MSAQQPTSPIYIGVFGGPGVGKSSFIREVITKNNSRLNLSPTNNVRLMKPITIDGQQVVFVDTPAFYNRALRNMDSADVLKRLAGFFTRLQQNGRQLNAAIFIHPKSNRQGAPWLVEDAQRNWSVFCQLVGDAFFPNVIFASTLWSNPPTQEQMSREAQIRAQEPFRSRIQRVSWASGPSAQAALDIVRIAMKRAPRQIAIQYELLNRQLRLADTAVGQVIIANSKQIAQQLGAHGNTQGAQRAMGVEGRLLQGYEQEANRWPVKQRRPPRQDPSAPRPAPAARRLAPRQSAPVSRPNSHASANNRVKQHGPVATPPMAYQPGRVNNNIQMKQMQPTPQPMMRMQPSQRAPPVHHHHHHTTHVQPPANHQTHSPRTSMVQNNTSYYNYSYEEHNTARRSPSPSYGGLAAGAGLVGGAVLSYAAYEAFDNDDNVEDDTQWVSDDSDLYADDSSIDMDDSPDYMDDDASNTYADNVDSYDNDPELVPAYTGGGDNSGDYSGGGVADSSGGGGDPGDGDGCCDCDDCCECDNCCDCDDCCECDNCCDCDDCCDCCGGGNDDDDGCCC